MASTLSLRAREQIWRKNVQRRRRIEQHATTHAEKQPAREARRKAEKALAKIRAQIRAREVPLRLRALHVAETLIGIIEVGGNNMGPKVTEIIRENGGTGPESWCGDFVAFCYRHAGSKAVTRSWAAVRLLGGVLGLQHVNSPAAGDLVRYNFSAGGFDHVGLFVKDNGDGTITAIEGNTGSSGAVSDSHSGHDGVKRKIRSKALVADYLRVTR